MRIRECRVERYGPLLGEEPIRFGGFSLLRGRNEEGKSLTIEAMLRMLFGTKRELRAFPGLAERVERDPGGYVIVESDDGGTWTLPHDGRLGELLGVNSRDCANLFVVRNNALAVQGDFYADVTERLTGLERDKLDRLLIELRRRGHLTETLRLASSKEHDYIGSRVQEAEDTLIPRIDELLRRAGEAKLDEIEGRLVAIEEQREANREELNRLELASRREHFTRCRDALEKLEKTMGERDALDAFTEEGRRRWQKARDNIEFYDEQRRENAERAERYRQSLSERQDDVSSRRQELAPLYERKKNVDEELRPSLKTYEGAETRRARAGAAAGTVTPVTIAVAVLFAGLLVVSTLVEQSYVDILAIVFAVLTVTAVLWYCYVAWLAGSRARARSTLLQQAVAAGLDGNSVDALRESIRSFQEELSMREHALGEADQEARSLERQLHDLVEKEQPRLAERRRGDEETIEELKRQSGAESLEDYRAALERREAYEREIQRLRDILSAELGGEARGASAAPDGQGAGRTGDRGETEAGAGPRGRAGELELWRRRVAALAEYAEAAPETEANEAREEALEREQQRLEEEAKELRESLDGFRRELDDVGRNANRILRVQETLPCDTTVDLREIRERLERFRDEVNREARIAATAVELFGEIRSEKEQSIAELFGPESAVTRSFSRITGGAYTSVEYASADEAGGDRVVVVTAGGRRLQAEQLSGGTYDQLFFAVRLALGEAMLGSQPGFFILDDPFVRADRERLRTQLAMLDTITRRGWQVLYFTAKDEVAEAIAEAGLGPPEEIDLDRFYRRSG